VLHFAELIRGLRQEKDQIGNMDDPEEAVCRLCCWVIVPYFPS
jgi:hypothetical protein